HAYVKELTARLGKKPTSVPARCSGANAEHDRPTFQPKPRPISQTILHTFSQVVKHVCGADVYIDEPISALELAEQLNRIAADTPFRLTLISNRGTQVWPTGSVFTECT